MMMTAKYSTWLIADPEIEILPRLIMTVNAGEAY
jgi:hypothetical protein